MNVRILKNVVGPGIDYRAGSIQNLSTGAGNALIAGGFAISEGPSPSGVIATLYSGFGYTPISPAASGYIGPSGWIADAPSNGAYYMPDNYTITVVFPGRQETTFDILKMRPKLT